MHTQSFHLWNAFVNVQRHDYAGWPPKCTGGERYKSNNSSSPTEVTTVYNGDRQFISHETLRARTSFSRNWLEWGGGEGQEGGGRRGSGIEMHLFSLSFFIPPPPFIFSYIICPPSFSLPCFFQTASTSALFRDTLAHRHTCKTHTLGVEMSFHDGMSHCRRTLSTTKQLIYRSQHILQRNNN